MSIDRTQLRAARDWLADYDRLQSANSELAERVRELTDQLAAAHRELERCSDRVLAGLEQPIPLEAAIRRVALAAKDSQWVVEIAGLGDEVRVRKLGESYGNTWISFAEAAALLEPAAIAHHVACSAFRTQPRGSAGCSCAMIEAAERGPDKLYRPEDHDHDDGAAMICNERNRQITQEGWTAEHDADHRNNQLAIAAACYAVAGTSAKCVKWKPPAALLQDAWPWDKSWDKRGKHDRLRQLVIAGALIAAEIDRLMAMFGRGAKALGGKPAEPASDKPIDRTQDADPPVTGGVGCPPEILPRP